MGKEDLKLEEAHLKLQQLEQDLQVKIHRLDTNNKKLEELGYSTQCWNYDQNKRLLAELSEENRKLEDEILFLQEQIKKLKPQKVA